MDDPTTVETLLDEGVLTESGGLTTSETYLAAVDRWRDRLTDTPEPGRDVVASTVDDPAVADRLGAVSEFDPEFVATYLALDETLDVYTAEELVRVAVGVDQLGPDHPPSDGAPDAFLPIRGSDIRTYTTLYERAIVYTWREDCDPCDAIRSDFDEIFADGAEETLLLAVYGPNWSELLHEEYDVDAGPTTLFMRDGAVDARLVGAPYTQVVAKEVEILREG